MAQFRIMYYVVKPLAGGWGHYFEPSPSLKQKGWKPVNLGVSPLREDPAKQDMARAKEAEVLAWRNGGAKPREVKRMTERHSFATLVDRYKADCDLRVAAGRLPRRERDPTVKPMSANTRTEYVSKLRILTMWATDPKQPGGEGNLAISSITPERVAKLRDALVRPDRKGRVMANRAHGALRVGRSLFGFAERQKMIAKGSNPFDKFELALPAARDQVWDEGGGTDDTDALLRAAAYLGHPSIGLAHQIAEWSAQRREDVLKFTISQWQTIHLPDRALVDALRGDEPDLKGFMLVQGKTKKPLLIPIVPPLRYAIEAAIAANKARKVPAMTILVNEKTGRPWAKDTFSRKFADARRLAIEPTPAAMATGMIPRPSLADLQFRDLRRTRVVRLAERGIDAIGIASITGHSIKTIEKMLDDVYRPRTTRQAAIAILTAHGATPMAGGAQKDRA